MDIISADDHIDLCYVPRTLWQSRLPARLRERAPKVIASEDRQVWVREDKVWGIWGSKRTDGRKVVFDDAGVPEEAEPGVWRATTPKYRLHDMTRDGVHAQVIYNFLDWSFEDQELKTACIEAFNSWLSEEFCSAAPARLYGLATLPTQDPDAALKELGRIAKLGLRGAVFDVFSTPNPIFDPVWDPLWATAAEAGIPMSVHIGGGIHTLHKIPRDVKWRHATFASAGPIQLDEILAIVLMCGMLERHPKLRIVFGEAGIGWIPYMVERLQYERENYRSITSELVPKIDPKELFQRQVFATFGNEKIGTKLIPDIGEDNVMWAADYPHGDGSFPHSMALIEDLFKASSPEIRRKALGANAKALYGIA